MKQISVRVFGVNVASWRYWVVEQAKRRGFIFSADAKPNRLVGIDNGCLILSRHVWIVAVCPLVVVFMLLLY